jgi:glycosyltransferase involved in cell wall biosynthesis
LPSPLSGYRRKLRLASQILQAEGLPALRDRISDRWRERSRRRSFRKVSGSPDLPAHPVLNLLSTSPSPRLGGLQTQLLHRLESEAGRRPVALFYPEAEAYRLEIDAGGRRRSLRIDGQLSSSSPVALLDPAFERAILEATTEIGARALHVEGLAGMPFGSLLELQRHGLQLILSVHDFSLFCPRPHLVESPQWRFCGYSQDPERCARCLAQDWSLPFGFQESRRALARELLAAAAAVVYPSEFLRQQHLELFPGIPRDRQRVIEPAVWGARRPRRLLERPIRHIAYVGSVQPHKGALVFEEIVQRLSTPAHPGLHWTVYGGGDANLLRRLRRLERVRVRGYYKSGSLIDRLRRDHVDLALLLSIWPESYGLVLSECMAAGVPVLAFDHGAVAERIRRHGGGLLVAPEAGAAGIASAVAALASGEEEMPRLGSPDMPAAEDAAAAFLELYGELGLS